MIRDGILVDTTPNGLISMRDSILDLIRKYLFPNAVQVNFPRSVTLQISKPSRKQYISPAQELILEIEEMDLFQHLGLIIPSIRGCYRAIEGKTYLVKGVWCFETLIHETLHACSRHSLEPELKKYDELFDGLTELYTGYILFREYQKCYTDCFIPTGQQCEITYRDYTKLWTAFCNFVSLKNTIEIYFPTRNIWDDEVDLFVARIKELGFDKFINPFGRAGLASITRFEIICNNTFGDDYFDICADRNRFTDFNNVHDD